MSLRPRPVGDIGPDENSRVFTPIFDGAVFEFLQPSLRRNRMLHRWFAITALLITAVPSRAQTAKPAKPYTPKRLADGHPDLQGVYDLATLTPMERPAGVEANLTKEQAAKMEAEAAKRRKAGDAA